MAEALKQYWYLAVALVAVAIFTLTGIALFFAKISLEELLGKK